MSLEMESAAGGRTDASHAPHTGGPIVPGPGPVSLDDADLVGQWCRRYCITADQFAAATKTVGPMPAALHCYLTSRGRQTKVVTDEMRTARPAIRPRDRRKKQVVASGDDPVSA